ncbi:hypothetical protein I3843_13G072100 [Carya illinoinensis]|nr:hypothetical protein I3760_13G084500 [Carya illinoinensis]KAG7949630.1 hypothetical protein I3843_13G072100 [Carya illinoinensis]
MSAIRVFLGGQRSNIFDPFTLPILGLCSLFFTNFYPFSYKETVPGAHLLKVDLSWLKKEEVKVEVEDGRVLQMSGERNVEKEDKNYTRHMLECISSKFLRSFRLLKNAQMNQIKAATENGVLTITIPKEVVKVPDVRVVEISR